MNVVEAVQATVYRPASGGRRYLTKAGAYRHEAWIRIKAKYPCDCSHLAAGEVADYAVWDSCERHAKHDYFEKVRSRLARFLRHLDEKRTTQAQADKEKRGT